MVRCDIAELPFEDGEFDALLCSHVLEHLDDDRPALLELARVLSPGGTALILVPTDSRLTETPEDPSIRSPLARAAAYKEPDHRRLYGLDFPRRLEAAGFVVSIDRYAEQLDESLVEAHRMGSPGMYVCTKPV
jgi:SAM-dependent methyltransferase